MAKRRLSWSFVISAILIGLVVWLAYHTRAEIVEAFHLLQTADIWWVAGAFAMVVCGFVCAGVIYGLVLESLGHREHLPWLIGTAVVGILLNQTVPMGSVAAYAFLVAALRKRGFPSGSVAVVAGTELLSWNGAALTMFSLGLLYLSLTADFTASTPIVISVLLTVVVAFVLVVIVTRPSDTIVRWLYQVRQLLSRIGVEWDPKSLELLVGEISDSRAIFAAQPWKFVRIMLLQMLIFVFHALALTALFHSIRVNVPYLHVLSAYGMSLIVSLFTLLPGGGGAVEAALSFTLHLQGVPLQGALSSAILFRLISFWLILPLGALFYRILTRTPKEST